jgi:hypothetical protein
VTRYGQQEGSAITRGLNALTIRTRKHAASKPEEISTGHHFIFKHTNTKELVMDQPDRFTSRFPQRNAVVILLLLTIVCALTDAGVTP